jgi:hypothetical protein
MASYEFTLVFQRYNDKVLKFRYQITNGDYGGFYAIVNNFFSNILEDSHLTEIFCAFPDLKDKIFNEYGEYRETYLRQIFDSYFSVSGLICSGNNEFTIQWCT